MLNPSRLTPTGVNAPGVIVRTPFTMPGPAKGSAHIWVYTQGLSLEALGSCFCPTLPPMFSFMVLVRVSLKSRLAR